MAKAVYIGINNLAQKVKAIYIGINGTARKVVKGYIGVNGVARLFWEAASKFQNFWFYYSTLAGDLIKAKYNGTATTELNQANGITFYAFVSSGISRGSHWYAAVAISTDSNMNIKWKMNGSTYPSDDGGSFITDEGDEWYWEACTIGRYDHEATYPADFTPDCFIDGNAYYDEDQDIYDYENMIKDLFLTSIYIDDFAENYRVSQRYNIVYGDVEKTIRKTIAVFLYKHIKNPYHINSAILVRYNAILTNLDAIVSELLSRIGGDSHIWLQVDLYDSNGRYITLMHGAGNDSVTTIINNITEQEGYKYIENYLSQALRWSAFEFVKIDASGNITYESLSTSSSSRTQYGGVQYSNTGAGSCYGGNIGLDFHIQQLSFTFHENFIVGNKYNLTKASIELTIRMAIQIFLDKNSSHSSDAGYITLKNNVNTLVSYFMGFINSGYRTFDIGLVQIEYSSYYNAIDVTVFYSFTDMSNQIIESVNQSEGYTYYTFNNDYDGEILDFSYIAWATLENPIDYGYNDDPSVDPLRIIGACLDVESGWDKVQLSNLGIDF